jgi:hypothetical protein
MRRERFWRIVLVATLFAGQWSAAVAEETAEQKYVVSVERIWDRAQHNAFTDLLEHEGILYCAFREGSGHIPGLNGTIRIIARPVRGGEWQSVGLLDEPHVDLRDPKLSITPEGRLMVNMGASYYHGSNRLRIESRVCRASFLDPRSEFGRSQLRFDALERVQFPKDIASDMDWLWRVTWHKGVAYGCLQQALHQRVLHVIRSDEGVKWEHVATLDVPDANETTLRFAEDDTLIAMIRRDAKSGDSLGYIGTAKPPYTDWELKPSNKRFGGPNFVQLPGGKWLTVSRDYDKKVSTQVWSLDQESAQVKPIVNLPSGGDTSYAGIAVDQKRDRVLLSYYSSHEGKSAIYLATLRLGAIEAAK